MQSNFGNAEDKEVRILLYKRVNAAVKKSGLKQKAIAERIGVSEQALCAMLAGQRKIYVEEFFGLCRVLGVTPDTLYGFQCDDKKAV